MTEPVVRIVIKNPTQSSDFRLDAALNSTVLELKQRLSQQYVNNPSPASQKLIFAGRLLQDEAILSDILRQHDLTIPQTFHLVVRPPQTPQQQPQSTPQQPQQPPLANEFPQPNFPPQGIPPGMQFYPYGAPPQNLPPHQQQQLAYMQYAYQQYAAAAAAAAAAGYPGAVPPGFRPYGFNPYFPGAVPPGAPPQAGPQPPQQPPNLPNQPPIRPPAAPGAEGANNMSLLLKLAFLVFILGQGGSQERLFLLAVGAVIVFLYQTGRIHIPRVRVAMQHIPANNNNVGANPNMENNNAQQPGQQQNAQQPIVQPQQNGFLGEVVLVLSSFVLSLFPTWQPPQAGAQQQQPPQQPQPQFPPENHF